MHEVDYEAIYPRDAEHRYRIYARRGQELEVLAVAPDPGGIGQALVQIHADCKEYGSRLADLGMIGVLDVIAAEWILLPWARPERPATFGPIPAPLAERRT